MKKIRVSQLIICKLASIIITIIFYLICNDILVTILLGLFFFMLLNILFDAPNNYQMIFYLCSFFSFLLGRIFVTEILGMPLSSLTPLLSEDGKRAMYITLILSLISLMVGYSVKFTFGEHRKYSLKGNNLIRNELYISNLRKVSKILFCVIEVIVVAENIERAIFNYSFGYFESYLSYSSNLPRFLIAFAEVEYIALAVYLATLPRKKDIFVPFCFYFVATISYAIGGFRFQLVSAVLLSVLYCLMRNKTDGCVWIKRRFIVLGCIALPVFIIVLQYISSWRLGLDAPSSDTNPIYSFLYSTGGSGYLIGYAHMCHDTLSERGILFSFGRVWKSLFANPIAKELFGTTVYRNQTVENALYGHSFGDAITYLMRYSSFLAGYGMGSCYIAELYQDFSYIGVVAGNLFIGAVIRKARQLKKDELFTNFLCIFIITILLRIPRDTFDYLISQFIGVKNILTVVLLHFIASSNVKKKVNNVKFYSDNHL